MGNSTLIAYNPGPLISGTTQIGDFAVGLPNQGLGIDSGGVTWWMGPNQDLGYVIARPVSGNTQPTPIFGVTASVGFYRTKSLTDNAFIGLSEYVSSKNGTPQTFSTGNQASAWLTNNGYWNSWSGVTNNIILEGFYSPGSVNAGYLVTSQYPLTADMDINFNNILNTISGAPLVISGSVTILSGSTTGYTQLYVNYNYDNLTEESSFEDLSFITTGNTDFGFSSEVSGATFNVTPTPTPSVTPRVTPSVTTTNTPTNTQTPTNTRTPTNTPTLTRTPSVTKTPTPTQTPTKTGTPTVTKTPTPTPTKPAAGLVAGYTIYLNPDSYAGATGNIGASAVTWPDSSANGYNASVIPVANTRVNYEKSGSLSYFQFNGTQTLFNNGQGTGTVSIPTFPTDNISANAIGWNSSGQATNTFTVSSWFYTSGQNSSAGGTMGMWQKLNSMDVRTQYSYGGFQLRLGRNSNITDNVVNGNYWVTGAWNNMTMVVTGVLNTGVSSLKLYSNGVLVQTLTPNRSTTTNIGVGSTASTPMMFLSSNDNVFAYTVRYGQQLLYNNIALTDAQVLQNYNYQKTIYGL